MRSLIFMLAIICTQVLNAQIDFEKGYFIDNQGNKIECFIKNLDWKNNPEQIVYKTGLNESEEKITSIMTIKEFCIYEITKYVKFDVHMQKVDTSMDKLSNRNSNFTEYKTVLLKVLVEGKATLYSYIDGDINIFFFKTLTSEIEQLIYKKFVNDKFQIIESNTFKQQLKNGFETSLISDKEFNNLSYQANELEAIFTEYNSFDNSNKIINEKVSEPNFFVKLIANLNNVGVSIDDPREFGYYDLKTDNKLFLAYGLELETLLPYGNKKWAFFTSPNFCNYRNEYNFVYNNQLIGAFNKDVNQKLILKVNIFEIPIGVKYYFFLNKNSKLFVDFAFVKNFAKSDYLFVDEYFIKGKVGNNYSFGFGYNHKNKFSIEYKFHTKKELLTDYISWSSKYISQSLNLTYTILKN